MSFRTRAFRRGASISALATAALVAATALPAWAHIEPDPKRVKPGADVTVAFSVEHGCGTSPTIKLSFKIPKGAKNVQAEPKDGWQESLSGGIVVFAGGPLDAKTPDTFSISFTAPSKKTVLRWKVLQQCEKGLVRWIDTAKGAEFPPADVGVGKNPPKIVEKS